jgi:stress response protein YsnF
LRSKQERFGVLKRQSSEREIATAPGMNTRKKRIQAPLIQREKAFIVSIENIL